MLSQELLRRRWMRNDQFHWRNWNLVGWWWQIVVDDVVRALRAIVGCLHLLTDGLEKSVRHWWSMWKRNSWLLSARSWEVK